VAAWFIRLEAKEGPVSALSDDNSLVRMRAVQGLGRLWGAEAVESLTPIVMDDPDPTVRRTAALALGRISNEDAQAVLDRARFDSDESVRQAAKFGLDGSSNRARIGIESGFRWRLLATRRR
jgi:HEAT repeat protein